MFRGLSLVVVMVLCCFGLLIVLCRSLLLLVVCRCEVSVLVVRCELVFSFVVVDGCVLRVVWSCYCRLLLLC